MCSSGTYVFRLCFPLETRIEQVLHQLRERKAKVMYDFRTETWNIVQCR
ncbi:YheU family protein [Geotalea uraniireducens]|nr:YheU family protein [Geotalea uraniireducens]